MQKPKNNTVEVIAENLLVVTFNGRSPVTDVYAQFSFMIVKNNLVLVTHIFYNDIFSNVINLNDSHKKTVMKYAYEKAERYRKEHPDQFNQSCSFYLEKKCTKLKEQIEDLEIELGQLKNELQLTESQLEYIR